MPRGESASIFHCNTLQSLTRHAQWMTGHTEMRVCKGSSTWWIFRKSFLTEITLLNASREINIWARRLKMTQKSSCWHFPPSLKSSRKIVIVKNLRLLNFILGTYMPYGYNTTSGGSSGTAGGYQADCLPCTAGYYCLNATVTPYKCGKGYYTKLGQSVCQVCLQVSCISIWNQCVLRSLRSLFQ